MANETKIQGYSGILYGWDGTTYRPFACATSSSLDTSVSMIESNTKCNPGVTEYVPNQFSYTLSVDGEYINSVTTYTTKASHDWLLTKQKAKTLLYWKYDTDGGTTVYYGSSYIADLNLTQSATETSTFSCTFNGVGSIETTDQVPT